MLNELRDKIHQNAIDHGFYDDENINIPEKLMLIVSELGEAMEAYRKDHYSDLDEYNKCIDIWDNYENKDKLLTNPFIPIFEKTIKDGFEDEIADTIIRLLDLCEYMKIDIKQHIELKMKYNESRPYKHGKKC